MQPMFTSRMTSTPTPDDGAPVNDAAQSVGAANTDTLYPTVVVNVEYRFLTAGR